MGKPSGQFWEFELPSGRILRLDEGQYPQGDAETWRWFKAYVSTQYPDDARALGLDPSKTVRGPLEQTGLNLVESVGSLANAGEGLLDMVTGDTSQGKIGDGLVGWAQRGESLQSILERRDDGGLFGVGSPGEAFGHITRSAAPTALAIGAGAVTGGLADAPLLGLLTAGGVEAATSAGDQYNTQNTIIQQEYDRDPAAFRRLPAFQKYLGQNRGDEAAALAAMKRDLGRGAGLTSAAINMGASAALGPFAEKLLGPSLGGLVNKLDKNLPVSKESITKAVGPMNLVGRTLGMAGTEGLEEGVQSGGEALSTNLFAQPAIPDRGAFDGVGQAAGLGALTGAFGGGMFGAGLAANTGVRRAEFAKKQKEQEAQVLQDRARTKVVEGNIGAINTTGDRLGAAAAADANKPAPPKIAGLLPNYGPTPTQTFDRPATPDLGEAGKVAQSIPDNAEIEIATKGKKGAKPSVKKVKARDHFKSIVEKPSENLNKAKKAYDEANTALEEVKRKAANKPEGRGTLYARRIAVEAKKVEAARAAVDKASAAYSEAVDAWNQVATTVKPTYAVDKKPSAAELKAVLSGNVDGATQATPAALPDSLPTIGQVRGEPKVVEPFPVKDGQLRDETNPNQVNVQPKTFLDKGAPPNPAYSPAPSWSTDTSGPGEQTPFLKNPEPAAAPVREVQTPELQRPGAVVAPINEEGQPQEDALSLSRRREVPPNPTEPVGSVDPQSTEGLPTRGYRRYQDMSPAEQEEFNLSDDAAYEPMPVSDPVTAAGLQPAPGTPAGQRVRPPARGWRVFKTKEDIDGNRIVQPVSQEFATQREAEDWVERNRPGRGRNVSPDAWWRVAEKKTADDTNKEMRANIAGQQAKHQYLRDLQKKVADVIEAELERVGLGRRVKAAGAIDLSAGQFGEFSLLDQWMRNPLTGQKEIIGVVGSIAVNVGVTNPNMTDAEFTEAVKDIFTHELTHALVRGGFITAPEYKMLENIVRKRKAPGPNGKPGSGLTYYEQAKLRYLQAPMARSLQEEGSFTPPPDALLVEEAIAELIRIEGREGAGMPISVPAKNILVRAFNAVKALFKAFQNPDMKAFYNLVTAIHDGTVAKRVIGKIGFDPNMPRDPLGRNLGATNAEARLVFPMPQRRKAAFDDFLQGEFRKTGERPPGIGRDPVTGTPYVAYNFLMKMSPDDLQISMGTAYRDNASETMERISNPGVGNRSYVMRGRAEPLTVSQVVDLSPIEANNPELAAKLATIPIIPDNSDSGAAGAFVLDEQGFQHILVNGKRTAVLLLNPDSFGSGSFTLAELVAHELAHAGQYYGDTLNSTGANAQYDPMWGVGSGKRTQRGSSLEAAIADTANLISAAANAEQIKAVRDKTFFSPMAEIFAEVERSVSHDVETYILDALLQTTEDGARFMTMAHNARGQSHASDAGVLRTNLVNAMQAGGDQATLSMRKLYSDLVAQHGVRYAPYIATTINNRAAQELFGFISKTSEQLAAADAMPEGRERDYTKGVIKYANKSIAAVFAGATYDQSRGERAATYAMQGKRTGSDMLPFLNSFKPNATNKRSADINAEDVAGAFQDPSSIMTPEEMDNLEGAVMAPPLTTTQLDYDSQKDLLNQLRAANAPKANTTAAMKLVSNVDQVKLFAQYIGAPAKDIMLATVDNNGKTGLISDELEENFPETYRSPNSANMKSYLSRMRNGVRKLMAQPEDEIRRAADMLGVTSSLLDQFVKLADRSKKEYFKGSDNDIMRQAYLAGKTSPKEMIQALIDQRKREGHEADIPNHGSLKVKASTIRREFGTTIDKRNTTTTREQRESIKSMRMSGMGSPEIAAKVGLPQPNVNGIISSYKEQGVEFPALRPGRKANTTAGMNLAAASATWINERRDIIADNSRRYSRVQDDNFIRGYTALHRALARTGVKNPSEFIRLNIDSAIGLGELVNETKARGGSIDTKSDPFLQEDLFRSLAKDEVEKLDEELFNPLIAAVDGLGLTEAQLQPLIDNNRVAKEWFDEQRSRGQKNINYVAAGIYMLAKHAPERNAFVRSRQRRGAELADAPEFGIGISDAEANEITSFIEGIADTQAIGRLLMASKDVSDGITQVRKDGGLIGQDVESTFRYYVPARGFNVENADDGLTNITVRTGRRGMIKGREDPRIKGREDIPNDPILNLGLMMRQAVIRKYKNRVLNSIRQLVENNASLLDGSNGGEFVARVADRKPRKDSPEWLVGKQDGREFYIELGPNFINIAQHLNPSNFNETYADILVKSTKVVEPVMRFLTGMLTRHNPAFILSNLPRDVMAGALNLDAYLPGAQAEYMATVAEAAPKVIKAMITGNYDENVAGETWGKIVKEYHDQGGSQDLFIDQDPSRLAQEFVNRMREVAGESGTQTGMLNGAKKTVKKLVEFIDSTNNAAEIVSRVTAYKIIRDKLIEQGMPIADAQARAVQVGRNLTVNFNKSGALGKGINSLYMFWNASMGGSAQIIKAAVQSPRLLNVIGGIAAFGMLWPTVCRALMGDEYDKIPQWVKDRNIIIPTLGALDGVGVNYLTIPMPYGYSWFASTGGIVNEAIYRSSDPTYGPAGAAAWAGIRTVDSFMNNWSPFGGAEDFGALLAPTLADPVIELYNNKNFAGNPIMPEPGMRDYDRQSQRYWANTNPVFVSAADILSRLSGGEGRREGLIEISPNALEYVTEFALGGVGRLFNQAATTVSGQADSVSDIPFVRTFAGSTQGGRNDAATYAETQERVKRVELEIKDKMKAGDQAGVADMRKRFAYEAKLVPIFQQAERQISKLNEVRNAIQNKQRYNPRGITEFEKQRLEQIDVQKRKIKAQAQARAQELRGT